MSDFRTPRDDRRGVRDAVKQLAALSFVACLCSVLGAKYLSQKFDASQFVTLSERESAAFRKLADLAPSASGARSGANAGRAGVDNMATATIPNKGASAERPLTPCGDSPK